MTKYRYTIALTFAALASALCANGLFAQDTTPEPVSSLTDSALYVPAQPGECNAVDHEYDDGNQVDLQWRRSVDDTTGNSQFLGYVIYRQVEGGAPDSLDFVLATADSVYNFADNRTEKNATYVYSISSAGQFGGLSPTVAADPVTPDFEWVNWSAGWEMILLTLLAGSVIWFIYHAKRGKDLFLRKIAGLQAVEEAIGRATEMGRPILFIPGIHDMDDVQTIAGMTILSRVAKQTADYDSRIFVPTRASLAMTAARETVREAYMTAGRPDAYKQDDIYYVTDEQFGYVAAVNGIMTRDKPATCFYLGAFFAESLILAETGNSIGAIQIAGTAMPAQLPFFVAACDYTLIGEELFAASAYLSGEPKQLGSLKGQDVGKAIAMVAMLVGAVLATLGASDGLNIELFQGIHESFVSVFLR